MKKLIVSIVMMLLLMCSEAHAGVDLSGKVERLWLDGRGKLWLKINQPAFDTYCKPGWYGFNLYIETNHPDYPYFYGLLSSAFSQAQTVRISNVSHFDGTVACDITETGYGVVVL